MKPQDLDRIMFAHMPDNIKIAVATYNTHKLVENALGITDLNFAKVAAHLSQMVADRQARWQGVGDGLLALHSLQKEAEGTNQSVAPLPSNVFDPNNAPWAPGRQTLNTPPPAPAPQGVVTAGTPVQVPNDPPVKAAPKGNVVAGKPAPVAAVAASAPLPVASTPVAGADQNVATPMPTERPIGLLARQTASNGMR